MDKRYAMVTHHGLESTKEADLEDLVGSRCWRHRNSGYCLELWKSLVGSSV